jgi:hypothetical protein
LNLLCDIWQFRTCLFFAVPLSAMASASEDGSSILLCDSGCFREVLYFLSYEYERHAIVQPEDNRDIVVFITSHTDNFCACV